MSIKRTFIMMLLSKLMLIGSLYFGFWILYEFAWWHKPWYVAFVDTGVNIVLAPFCFMAWVVLEMWIRDPSTMPVFRKLPEEVAKEPKQSDSIYDK